jgi:DNA-binding Lrp family transcriptional regulator
VDKVDHAIIEQLQANGRLSNIELAERVGLSPSPCLRRVRQLESSGVIRGYHAAIDPAAVGRGFNVTLHVEMAAQDRATLEAFEAAVLDIDAIVQCQRMFGQPDYLIHVAVADLDSYERLYSTQLIGLPGVARTNSQFAMKLVKGSKACLAP